LISANITGICVAVLKSQIQSHSVVYFKSIN